MAPVTMAAPLRAALVPAVSRGHTQRQFCSAPAGPRRPTAKQMGKRSTVSAAVSESSFSAPSQAATSVQRDVGEVFAADKRPIVLFDGVCNMCNGGVTFCLDWDKKGVVRFAALQSDVGRALLKRCGRRPDDISSIVLVEEGACYIKSEAVLRIGKELDMPLPILTTFAFPLPLFFRDTVYDFIAENRYIVFGRTESCRLSDERFEDRFVDWSE